MASADLQTVQIDDGTFKYVLIEVEAKGQTANLVRGINGAAYHADSAQPTVTVLERHAIAYQILGGGRIKHSPADKTIHIYGHSIGFPWEGGEFKHAVTKALCEKAYGAAYTVTFDTEGY